MTSPLSPQARPYLLVHEQLQAAVKSKDQAYAERDMLVAALSKVYPSHLLRHPDSDTSWEDDWRNIICVHLPTGQATWHVHDTEWHLFMHLTPDGVPCDGWDGHTTPEKYERLSALDKDWRN